MTSDQPSTVIGSSGKMQDRTIGLLDCSWWGTGHHRAFFQGVSTAIVERGDRVVAIVPAGVVPRHETIVATSPRIPVRRVLKAARWHRSAVKLLEAEGADHLIDLYLDLSASRYALMPTVPRNGVFVLHGIPVNGRPTGLIGHMRLRMSIRGMRRISRNAGQIIVHTSTAAEWLRQRSIPSTTLRLPSNRILQLRLSSTDTPIRKPFVLIIGDTRPEKGFDLAVQAARLVSQDVNVIAVGRPPPYQLPAYIDHLGFVDDERLAALQHQAAATLVPYTDAFHQKGAASSVAVESLISGCPLVAPRWMSPQLAAAPEAVETYTDATPSSLAEAIQRAVAMAKPRRKLLMSGLAERVTRLHSYEVYVHAFDERRGPPNGTP